MFTSWQMMIAELCVGGFAWGFLLPSRAMDDPVAQKVAVGLLLMTILLMLLSLAALACQSLLRRRAK